MTRDKRLKPNPPLPSPGPYLATVIGHVDPTYMGTLEVQLFRQAGNDGDFAGQLHYVNYLSPFAGQTGLPYVTQNDGFNETQKSYGFWMIPPDPGTIVMVIFVDGDPRKGYWMGCVQDLNMNFMMPGYASTERVTTKTTDKSRVPVAEYNKVLNQNETAQDLTQLQKPATPQEVALNKQGLLKDDIRGITTSSARREVPSAVFGISTPGPLDKLSGKKGLVGKKQNEINHFVSRLTGSSFVMDDGDSRWERKKTPSEGPPDYADVQGGETGLRDRPHNELIRLRTRTGHQILLHNSEDLIYIGNSRGTAWIELTSDGKIDIFTEDSINIRTKKDFNFYADRDFNLEVGRNLNIKVQGEMHTHVIKDQILIVDANQKIHIKANKDETVDSNSTYKIGGNYDTNTGGHIWETSGGTNETKAGGNIIETAPNIHMNGPQAATATTAVKPDPLTVHKVVDLPAQDKRDSLTEITTILRRVPTYEPYPHHENLDPKKYKPEKTDRDSEERYKGNTSTMKETATGWNKYSTSRDTFKRS